METVRSQRLRLGMRRSAGERVEEAIRASRLAGEFRSAFARRLRGDAAEPPLPAERAVAAERRRCSVRGAVSTRTRSGRPRETSWERMEANERLGLREDMKRLPGERLARAFSLSQFANALHEAGKKLR